jgi:hypothetical protein
MLTELRKMVVNRTMGRTIRGAMAAALMVSAALAENPNLPKPEPFDVGLANAPVSIQPDPDKTYELLYKKVSNEAPGRVMVKVGTLAGKQVNIMQPGEEIELATPEGRFSVAIQKMLIDKAVSLGFIKGGDDLFVALFEVAPDKGSEHTFGRQVSNVVVYGPKGTSIGNTERSPSDQEVAEKNGKQLLAELRKRAESGDPKAQWALGEMYKTGTGMPLDPKKAVEWWRKAAEQGYVDAQVDLAGAYLLGKGTGRNYKQAAAWYLKAAGQGHARAQDAMGAMHLNGVGVPKDEARAAAWFRQSADQGLAEGQYSMGLVYSAGWGVPKDAGQAVAWFLKAAEQGHAKAMFKLAQCYTHGEGVPESASKLFMWISLAAMYATGEDRTEYSLLRDKVAEHLPPSTVAEAKDVVGAWVAAYDLRKKK